MAMSPFDPFALERWDPFSEMTSLRDAMNRLMESSVVRPSLGLSSATGIDMPLEISETDTEYRVQAHVPGMKPEDVRISVHNNVVRLEGERGEEQEHKEGGRTVYTEHRYGSFARSFSLPIPVDVDRSRADFKDGVLTLTLPKTEAAKPRQIQVQSTTPAIEGQTTQRSPGRASRARHASTRPSTRQSSGTGSGSPSKAGAKRGSTAARSTSGRRQTQ